MSLHFLSGAAAHRPDSDGAQEQQRRQGAVLLQQMRHPPPGQWAADLYEQANHFTGTLFLALSRVSQTWASATAVLERRKRRDRTTFSKSAVAVVKAVSHDGGAGNDEDYAPVYDHPVAHRLAEANPTESFGSMLGYMALQQGLTGEAPVWFVPNCDGKPVELYALPRAQMQFQPGAEGGYWRVTPYLSNGSAWGFGTLGSRMATSTLLPLKEIQRLMSPHALSRQMGWSPLSACAVQIDVDEAINKARHSHMMQAMQPGAVVYLPNMDEGSVARATEDLKGKYAGAHQWRKPMVVTTPPGGDGKPMVSQLTPSAIELDFIESLKFTVNFVAAALDVPPGVLGIADNDSYAKAYATRQEMHDRQSGRLKGAADFFTRHLCGPWSRKPGEFRCKITLPRVVNRERDQFSASELAQNDLITYNEGRRLNDMKPVPDPDADTLPRSVYIAKLQAASVPQPEPQAVPGAMPGMDGAMPADGAEQPGAEQGQGDDADMDAVTQAALQSLGVGGEQQPDAEQKALAPTSPHRSGVFTDAKGHKYKLQDGKRVPVGGSQPPPVPNAPPPPTARPALPGTVPQPATDAGHDALARKMLADLGMTSLPQVTPGGKVHRITDGASLRAFYADGGQLPDHMATIAAQKVKVQNRAVLDRVQTWAATQADKHADRVAAHFGIDRARAHKLLVSAIKKIAEHAREGGGWGAGIRITDKRSGKTASITPKGGTPVSAPPKPSNPAGKGSLPPRPTVGKGFDPNEKRDSDGRWTEGGASGQAKSYRDAAKRTLDAARGGQRVRKDSVDDIGRNLHHLTDDQRAEWESAADLLAEAQGRAKAPKAPAAAVPKSAAAVHDMIRAGAGHLNADAARAHAEQSGNVLARMPEAAHARIGAHLAGAHADSERGMAERVLADHAESWKAKAPGVYEAMEKSLRGGGAAAMYSRHTRTLYMPEGFDPDEHKGRGDVKELRMRTMGGLYAHELTHTIDGPAHEYSGDASWQEAFRDEIEVPHGQPAKLTSYAATKPSEGFAEFGRLLYSGNVPLAEVEARFPKCAAVFKAHAIWPAEAAAPTVAKAVRTMLAEMFGRRVKTPDGHLDVLLPEPVGKAMDGANTLDDAAGGFLVQPGRRKKVRPGFAEFLKALCDQRS